MISDPKFAPRRADLTYLSRRSRPKDKQAREPAAAAATTGASTKIDYHRRDRDRAPTQPPARDPAAARGPAPERDRTPAPDATPTSAPKIDYTRRDRTPATPPPAAAPSEPRRPAASGSLDLSEPATTPPNPPNRAPAGHSPSPGSSGLDLSEPATSSTPTSSAPASTSGSLDLSAAPESRPAAAAQPAPAAAAPRRGAQRLRRDAHVEGTAQHLMSIKQPTVTLTRMQSGIGRLEIEAVCAPEVGDLRLGAVYQMRSGGSFTVQHADGHRYAPPNSRRPVIVAGREEYERLAIDLRQVRDIERIGVYAYSESRTELTWNGTLVLTTFGGARLELPLETLYAGRIAMLVSLYNVDGEIVVRAELETIAGDVRETARAYGYDRITWRDERTPVD